MTDALMSAPVAAPQRLESLDLLRGFALCGILLVNIISMGGIWEAYVPMSTPNLENPDWSAWLVQHVFLQGSMRGLFTLLFGAGMLLITLRGGSGKGTIEAADVYFRRCIALLVLGVGNVTILLFPGDILYVYGLSGFFLFAFRAARPRALILTSVLLIALLTGFQGASAYKRAVEAREGRAVAESHLPAERLNSKQREALDAYQAAVAARQPTREARAEQTEQRTGGPVSLLKWSVHTWVDYAASSYTIILVMECVAFMLLGMALFKLGVLTGEQSLRFYLLLMAAGYAVGLSINGAQAVAFWRNDFSPELWLSRATYEVGRLGVTLGHVGLILTLWKLNAFGFVGTGLKAMGRMALSNYLAQSAITSLLFYGLDLWGRFDWWTLWGIAAIIWVALAIGSLLWLRVFAFGPMEWALRLVAYGKVPAVRRARLVTAP
ncbi:DUF418 domain-containing protein [Brevundimonas sp. NPDC090276]|uniref:DUF418 domain-containing protein n=1 Tax=Brevundimonas sp. NPDC090276 TaxID=3363956 RepID=UPI00383AC79A